MLCCFAQLSAIKFSVYAACKRAKKRRAAKTLVPAMATSSEKTPGSARCLERGHEQKKGCDAQHCKPRAEVVPSYEAPKLTQQTIICEQSHSKPRYRGAGPCGIPKKIEFELLKTMRATRWQALGSCSSSLLGDC